MCDDVHHSSPLPDHMTYLILDLFNSTSRLIIVRALDNVI